MTGNEMVPVLMFITLGVALLAGVVSVILFPRKRRHHGIYVDAFIGGETSPDDREVRQPGDRLQGL